ncbi:MAG: uracil-DNA glycosylase family protein [Bacteroidales bacterium]|jgi:uracil-DNA glycosylase
MDIVSKALQVRNKLTDCPENPIDKTLAPVAPFKGKGQIKLVIIGQAPTIRNVNKRDRITCALNLDKVSPLKTYVEKICAGLGITLDNVYATNVFKYFYKNPPSDTPAVLADHLQDNLALLKEELALYRHCTIITLGEPVLQLLSNKKHKIRNYWQYKDTDFHSLAATDNQLNHCIYPFPHQPSLRQNLYKINLQSYIDFVAQRIK